MIVKKYLLSLFVLLLSLYGFSQQTGRVSGRIVNYKNEPLESINVLLQGTTLGGSTDDNGNFQILNVPEGVYTLQASGVGFSIQKQDIRVTNGKSTTLNLQLNESESLLSEVEILGIADQNYNVVSTKTDKLPAKLIDMPQSIDVVNRSMIDDRQAFLYKDVVRNTTGVNLQSSSNDIMIRGFSLQGGGASGSSQFLNGMRNFYVGYSNDLNLTNIERVEVLKGPASVLFGANSPGGSINAITKKPLAEERYTVGASFGTWGRYRTDVDVTGPLSKDKRLLYRLNAGYQSDPDYRDFVYRNNFLVAPSVTYQQNKTSITAEVVYNKVDKTFWYDWGVPLWNNDVFAVPLEYTPHEPIDKVVYNNLVVMLELDQKITDNLNFHTRFNSSQNRTDGKTHSPLFFNPIPGTDSLVSRVYREMIEDNSGTYFSNYLTWKPNAGSIRFTVTGGFDYYKTKYFYNIDQAGFLDGVPKINVFKPSYRSATPDSYNVVGGFYAFDFTSFSGVYLMSLVEFSDRLKMMIAGRYDRYNFESFPGKTPNDTKAFLPNIGLTYQPLKGVSVYGSYSKGFMPQNSQSPDIGGPFDPEYSSQIEFGLKKEFFDGQWMATAAWYSIDRENVLVPVDPANPYGQRQATGKAKSTGVEFDLLGEIAQGWNISAGYAYNDSKMTNSTYDFVLERQANNAPYHNANLWTRYNFSGALSGFGLSAGLWHVGKRSTDGTLDFPSAALVTLPEYTVIDAGITYRFDNVLLNLYCDNLFNERYIYGASNAYYMQPGKPRNFMLRIQFSL